MAISISRYIAIVLGILTPLAETVRRWSTWQENPPALFDDYILGAFLLYGAWQLPGPSCAGWLTIASSSNCTDIA
jgi:hypothetical protein